MLKAQTFLIYEAFEIIIVCKHENVIIAAFKIIPLSFESLNNGQKLTIMSLVSYLIKNHRLRKIGYWIQLT